MNTIKCKFATFPIPSGELTKQSKDTGISLLISIGEQRKSFTLIGQRAMPQFTSSIDRTTIQKPTGFMEVEAHYIVNALSEMKLDGIPVPSEISSAIAKVKLAKYI